MGSVKVKNFLATGWIWLIHPPIQPFLSGLSKSLVVLTTACTLCM